MRFSDAKAKELFQNAFLADGMLEAAIREIDKGDKERAVQLTTRALTRVRRILELVKEAR